MIRKATLAGGEGEGAAKQRVALLEQARAELASQVKAYPPAQKLVDWIDGQIRPQQRLAALGKALTAGKLGDGSARLLSDFLRIMDRTERPGMLAIEHPLAVWIGAMQAGENDYFGSLDEAQLKDARALALDKVRLRWKEKRDPLWLVPLLTNAAPGTLSEDELKGAAAVPVTSPAYQSVQYHLARLAFIGGKGDQADAMVSAMLDKYGAEMSTANRNRWLGLKLVTAKTLEAFVAAAPRKRAEAPEAGAVPITDEAGKPAPSPETDSDYERHLLAHLTLAQLKQIDAMPSKPRSTDLALVIWTRAVLAGDYASADAYTERLMKGRDSTRHLYERFKAATDPAAKKQAAILIMVNAPEFNPQLIEPGSGGVRTWGCSGYSGDGYTPLDAKFPNFVSKEARAEVQQEQKRLLSLPRRSYFLAQPLLEWARANQADPEVPKALHFFVASTRMECNASDANEASYKPKKSYSQEAFELLHKRYPKSPWAAKTKYYY